MADQETKQAVRDMKETVRDEMNRAGESVADEARSVANQASELGRDHAEQRFEQGRDRIGGEVEAVGSAVNRAAQRLRDENSPLASYADEIAGQISSFSSNLENTSLEDVATKTRRLARENPALFVMGSVVAGIAASRFFKASEPQAPTSGGHASGGRDASGYGRESVDRGYESDDYLEGRRAALAGSVPDYRSPIASPSRPRRDMPSGVATGVARAPMDSPDTRNDAGETRTAGVN